jgi:type IV pilus assembly protein PilY1
MNPPNRRLLLALLVALAGLGWLRPAPAAAQSDTALFSTFVQPNVLLMLDTSLSMNEIVWHPDFDPTATYSCADFDPDTIYIVSSDVTITACTRTRTVFEDNKITEDTRWRGSYLNWYFSPEADAAYAEIQQGSNGTPSSCTGGANYAKYKRAKIEAAKRALHEIVCEVNQTINVRFGVMIFREAGSGTWDPNGGYVVEPVEEYSSIVAADLLASFQSIDAETFTMLGESLFQAYTYFMSRNLADLPVGQDGTTKFPLYQYETKVNSPGGAYTTTKIPVSPVQLRCQKNFVIIVTDGEPTFDDFQTASPTNTAAGFSDFANLIGDYNNDSETEFQDDLVCTNCRTALYLDDIAYYMRTNDFRPDMAGDQLIDTYTIGFTTGPTADTLLTKTAQLGNGIFFKANNPEQMAAAIIDAFADIIEKAQSFTAATVPASRTRDGENIYVSLFVPSSKKPYWEGHLRSFQMTGAGEIYDKNGNCALDDPTPNQCFSGAFLPTAEPYWDAFDKIPAAGARNNLSVSKLVAGTPTEVAFDDTLLATDLDVVYPPVGLYPGSTATNATGLKDEIIANVRGCEFGTGVLTADVSTPLACVKRYATQSDIFHSNPVVVGQPAMFDGDPSYGQFMQNFAQRERVIIAGSNGGFLQAFNAGTYQVAATPPGYDAGTGVEVFGFMPWRARKNIRFKPIDTGNRDYYYVDGSPTVSDVWLYPTPTAAAKNADGSEWKTVAVSGMRQGGEAIFALDITDPTANGYPGYMWELPAENAPASLSQYFGESWSDPVLTRIRVAVSGNDNSGEGFERWVVIVAGGYDPSGDPNLPASYNAAATAGRGIFIVDVKTGEVLAQQVFTPAAAAGDPRKEMVYAIASSPAVFDVDFDGFADSIYVGDLGGNLWKWVIEPIGEDRVNDGGSPDDQPNWPFRKLFEAPVGTDNKSTGSHYKSFFFPPQATFKSGTMWLLFGSGERANTSFKGLLDSKGDVVNTTEDNNRFYALKDGDPLETWSVPQALATESLMLDVSNTQQTCADASSYRGYYFLAAEAEKFVTNIEIFVGYVFVGSYIPTEPIDPCDLAGESGLYVFRVHCGEGFFPDASGDSMRKISLGTGLPTDPRITVGTDGDATNRVIINKQGGEIVNFEAPPGFNGHGMFYWRELHQ